MRNDDEELRPRALMAVVACCRRQTPDRVRVSATRRAEMTNLRLQKAIRRIGSIYQNGHGLTLRVEHAVDAACLLIIGRRQDLACSFEAVSVPAGAVGHPLVGGLAGLVFIPFGLHKLFVHLAQRSAELVERNVAMTAMTFDLVGVAAPFGHSCRHGVGVQ